MATTRFILGIFGLVGFVGHRLPDRHLLNTAAQEKILNIARSQLYVRENGKNNYGKEIKEYLAYTNVAEGNPYCAAFISWVFYKAGHKEPRTAWSPALFPVDKRIKNPQAADLLGLYAVAKQRIVHCGIVEKLENDWVISLEANTNDSGSSDGNGNYRKRRHKRTIWCYARWLKKEEVRNE